ncbi:MAG: hypothetical protein BWY85_00860 [Firmicutes bacterium ADurb.Bin506]|nr:MAG: hypothetical protein BWY85_00860 [Firmicutes bacterium ADurb.Bin506]
MRVNGLNAAIDDRLMTTPSPRSAMILPNTWVGSIVPMMLRLNTHCIASAGMSKNDMVSLAVASGLLPPAPLIKMSTVPKALSTSSLAFSSDFLSSTSTGTAMAVPFLRVMSATTALAAASFLSSTATFTPRSASAIDISLHSTPPPPVTTATLPFKSNILSMAVPPLLHLPVLVYLLRALFASATNCSALAVNSSHLP